MLEFLNIDSFIRALSDVTVRLQNPVTGLDGNIMHQVHVPKGTVVLPTSWWCNAAKEVWGEDALEWKPERWLSPLPAALDEARIPGIYANLYVYPCEPRMNYC